MKKLKPVNSNVNNCVLKICTLFSYMYHKTSTLMMAMEQSKQVSAMNK
jgi:hypothetical protein